MTKRTTATGNPKTRRSSGQFLPLPWHARHDYYLACLRLVGLDAAEHRFLTGEGTNGGTIVHSCRFSCLGDADLPYSHTRGGFLRGFVSSGGEGNSKWPLAD